MKSPESDFLKRKYDLHTAPEVESAAKRTEFHTKEKVPQDPSVRIENYLNRFREIIDREDPHEREMGMEALKTVLHRKFVIKEDEIPEGYFDLQKRIAREQGHGNIEITPELKQQAAEVIIRDQAQSLDRWIDYLASEDAPYPDWLKYFAFRSIVGMSEYDKEKKEFRKRSKGTTGLFPDLNREALAYVLDAIEKQYGKGEKIKDSPEFEKLLQGANFAKLYAWAIEKVTPASQEQKEKTKGEWRKYDQGTDPALLYESLQGHGTNWCTAGEGVATAQLEADDFYVYYSEDEHGDFTVPRVAIRMQGGSIAEVRGVADKDQNLEGNMTEISEAKTNTLPGAEPYKKKTADMKYLTKIELKTKNNEQLTKDDLTFLYEMDSNIEGFGYERDPRIKELRSQRNPDEDMLVIFECTKEKIAKDISEINKDTKAYVGPLVPHIFEKIQEFNIDHIYTSFPEGKIWKISLEIGGKTKDELIQELEAHNICISGYAIDMLESKDFTTLTESESQNFIRLKVGDLGLPKGRNPRIDEIYARIEKLGLELCPAETGPQYRLQYMDQLMNEWVRIGMKQISGRGGGLGIWRLDRDGDGLWLLGDSWASPGRTWSPGGVFVFRLRPPSHKATEGQASQKN